MKNRTFRRLCITRGPSCLSMYQNRLNQKGALLIGLIITMIVLGLLGGALVYIFSTSTRENIIGNFSQRAYYAAESGMRFAVATYRNPPDGTHATGQSLFNALNGQTIPLPNNGQAALTIANTVGSTAINTTASGNQTINLGGDLAVTDASQFPPQNGYFAIVGVPGKFFHYKEKGGNTLNLIAGGPPGYFDLPSGDRLVAGGTQIAAPKNQVSISSTGTYPLVNPFSVSRTTEYGWILSGLLSDTSTPVEPNFDPTKWSIDKPNPITPEYVASGGEMAGGPGWGSWGTFRWNAGEGAIQVLQPASVGGQKRFLLAYNQDYFPDVWITQGQYLSYDAQVKIKTWNEATANHLYNFMGGLSFRLDNSDSAAFSSLGVSFKRGNDDPFNLPYSDRPYIVLWRDKPTGQAREMIAYKELTSASGIISETVAPVTILNDPLTTLGNWDPSTLWVHNSTDLYASSGTCQPSSSTYLTLNSPRDINTSSELTFRHFEPAPRTNSIYRVRIQTTTDDGVTWSDSQIITITPGNWTTTTVPLTIATPAKMRLQFQYENTGATVKTDAWSIDDVNIVTTGGVSHLVDWSTILVRIKELPSPSTTTNSSGGTSIFLGQRVNEIEIFYGSPTDHGSGNNNPRDDDRLANPRCVSSPCAGNWPPRDLALLQSADDKFTLVYGWEGWNYSNSCKPDCTVPFPVTKTDGCKFELAGGGPTDTGNPEYRAIIRTNCYLTSQPADPPYSINVNSEVGLSAFGTEIAGSVYFDDFGINIGGEGGIPYVDVIQQ